MEAGVATNDDTDTALRDLWEDLARQARGVHCPEHYVEPWRVRVIGSAPRFKLDLAGCCPGIGRAIDEMIANDPRIRGPR
jgi:hypothetical protein